MLPPLASSLAYSNYTAWVEEHDGAELPDVAPGVSVEDLYRSSEREVRSQAAFLLRWREDGVAATVAVFLAHMNMLLDAATHTHTTGTVLRSMPHAPIARLQSAAADDAVLFRCATHRRPS